MSYVEVLRSIVPILEQTDIQYMITGSIAAAYYGLGRATYDLDIVIASLPCSMFLIPPAAGKSILF
jgi:hypothetical protein